MRETPSHDRISSSGALRPRGSSSASGRLPIAEAPPEHARRRRGLLFVAAVLVVVAAAAAAVQYGRSRDEAMASAGLPPTYLMACRACKMRFETPAGEYRQALARRSNREANRIRCPQCGADDSAYRTQSGMDGLGELNADGMAKERRMPVGPMSGQD